MADALAPQHLAALVIVVVAMLSSPSRALGAWWALVATVFCAAAPYAVVLVGVRRGVYSDRELRHRHERVRPLALGIVSVLIGTAIMALGGAPRELIALSASMLAGLGVCVAVTTVWKISVHVGAAGGCLAVLVAVLGPWVAGLSPLVALLAWARVRTSSHTVAQVVAGAVVGASVAGSVFAALT